ncbi:hypothetical protein GCM10009872_57810 [Actinopolymorpha rutila]
MTVTGFGRAARARAAAEAGLAEAVTDALGEMEVLGDAEALADGEALWAGEPPPEQATSPAARSTQTTRAHTRRTDTAVRLSRWWGVLRTLTHRGPRHVPSGS